MLVVPSGAEYAWEEKSRPKGTFEVSSSTES